MAGQTFLLTKKTWIHEREQIIKEIGGNQYTTKDATLKLVFEIEIRQSVELTSDERNNFPFGIAGGFHSLIQDKIMDSRMTELRGYARNQLDPHGLASSFTSSLMDLATKNIPAHIVVPVEDKHHGLASHISHDQRVPVPIDIPSWAKLNSIPFITEENMKNNEWWHSWPTLDSAVSNKDPRFISKGYMRIYTA